MGTCCSKDSNEGGDWVGIVGVPDDDDDEHELQKQDETTEGDSGARVRLRGSSRAISMYSKRGTKGVNQDAMTAWEDFIGEKGTIFCGVFDGHGPDGHRIARQVRDQLPSKLSSVIQLLQTKRSSNSDDIDALEKDDGTSENKGRDDTRDIPKLSTNENNGSDDTRDSPKQTTDENIRLSSWEANIVKSFKEMDDEFSNDPSIDSFCSGTTAVTIVKQGDHLIIANLGDSRAVLCTKGQNGQLIPIQLTVDLKPNVSSEAERIKKCKGRVFALDKEPEVFRIWMPNENCPGLAMARAFGDFCLKEYGLISTPELSYRRLTQDDEFVVLATDGVWDVLNNEKVVRIVASARKRSLAAKLLVVHAVIAWKTKYPGSKIDDCAVICLFFKNKSSLEGSKGVLSQQEKGDTQSELSKVEVSSVASSIEMPPGAEEWNDPDGESRVNTLIEVPAYSGGLSRRKPSKEPEDARD